MFTFWEELHSLLFSLYYVFFCNFNGSPCWLREGTVVLFVHVSRHCLPFALEDSVISLHGYFRLYI